MGTAFVLIPPGMISIRVILAAAILVALSPGLPKAGRPKAEPLKLQGCIVDDSGQPVAAATIRALADEKPISGAIADFSGCFSLMVPERQLSDLQLEVSSLGFNPATIRLDSLSIGDVTPPLKIVLASSPVRLPSIAVHPEPEPDQIHLQLDANTLNRRASHSLVPTNPVGAIKSAQVARAGSSHSSRLRIYGTSPDYLLNGLPIGQDPDHYGIFTVIPSSIVGRLDAELLGTSARHRLPSVIELTTLEPFESHLRLSGSVSTIEATATGSLGNDNLFALGSLRKSVLDKLVDRIEVSSNRRTLPPTNFQDITVHGGWRIDQNIALFVDQYAVRDFLVYDVESSVAGNQSSTFQHTSRQFTSLRMRANLSRVVLNARAGWREETEQYEAEPEDSELSGGVVLRLEEERRSLVSSADITVSLGDWLFSGGADWAAEVSRRTELSHRNWNFLSPFANSDNPFVYQDVLNNSWGSYHDNNSGSMTAGAYVQSQRDFGRLALEAGLRREYFGDLARTTELVWRARAAYTVSDETSVRLYGGEFAASPVGTLLEDYQVLIRAQVESLRPVRTLLLSAALQQGSASLVLFHKHLSHLPAICPVFSDGLVIETPELTVRSEGEAVFWGGSIGWEQTGWPHRALDVEASYALTSGRKIEQGVTMSYGLTARHRLHTGLSWHVSDRLTLGTEVDARSGYFYTPTQPTNSTFQEQAFSRESYVAELSRHNTVPFPAHVSLNVNVEWKVGRGVLFGAVSNVTNRANPIINTAGGFVHDAGILPTVGYRISF